VSAPEGWYPDPSGNGANYWNGERWTAHTDSLPTSTPPPGARPLAIARTTPGGLSQTYLASLIAVAAIVIGSISPWAHNALASANGTQGDGAFTLILAVIAAAILLRSEGVQEDPSSRAATWALALGVLVVLIAVGTYISITGRTATIAGQVVHTEDTSWGIDATILGGVGLVVTGWLLRR
jgi:hypothetical protein